MESSDYGVLDIIDGGDFNKFVSILSGNNENIKRIRMNVVINRVFNNNNEICKRQFFNYIVDSDGKYGWNIIDYTIIIAYCAQQSDFKLLLKIIKNVDKTKYNLKMQFGTFQGGDKWVPEIVKCSRFAKRSRASILDFCVRSRFPHCNSKVDYNASDFDINIQSNKETIDLINDKNNDNYKCFELLITNMVDLELDDTVLIYDCYENGKYSFVEYLISSNICKNYCGVLIHCCKYPQRWKLRSLNMLLNEHKHNDRPEWRTNNASAKTVRNGVEYNTITVDEKNDGSVDDGKKEDDNDRYRYLDVFTSDCKLRGAASYEGYDSLLPVSCRAVADTNCLQWCVNIGMKLLWQEKHEYVEQNAGVSSNNSSNSSHRWNGKCNYNSDSMGAAFDCFRLIMECKNISEKNLNKLLNTRMKDNVHIIETCMANSIVNNSFIKYLIQNNDKKRWKIDYRESNVLQLACLVGNYKMLQMIINDIYHGMDMHKSKGSMRGIDVQNVLNQLGLTKRSFNVTSYDICINNFQSIHFYKSICNKNDSKQFAKVRNLFYCCINSNESIVLDLELNSDGHNAQKANHFEFLHQLNSYQRKLLCLGYLRNGGYEYPDNIATVLNRYFDWEFGNMQCFKYLVNNLSLDKFDYNILKSKNNHNNYNYSKGRLNTCRQLPTDYISPWEMESDSETDVTGDFDFGLCELYPNIIYDCILQCKTVMLRILVEKCTKYNFTLKKRNISGDNNIYQRLYNLFPFACLIANSSMVKYLLSLFKNRKDFDINAAKVISGSQRSTVDDLKLSMTPLFAVATSNADTIKSLRNGDEFKYKRPGESNDNDDSYNIIEELECFKTLLSDTNINPNTKCMGKTLFIRCIENNKIHLIEYMFDLAFNYNNDKKKYKFDFKTMHKTYAGNYLYCLEVALNNYLFEMVKFLLKNIIKYRIFIFKEIARMCQRLLFLVVDKAETNMATINYTKKFNIFTYNDGYFDIFTHLLSGKELIKNKETDQRFVVITEQLIDKCIKQKQIKYLEYMMKNWKFLSASAISNNNKFDESDNLTRIKQCISEQRNLKDGSESSQDDKHVTRRTSIAICGSSRDDRIITGFGESYSESEFTSSWSSADVSSGY